MRVLLTGYADINAVIDAVNKGKIFHYLSKPWNEEELDMTIIRAYEIYEQKFLDKDFNEKLIRTNDQLEFLLRQKLDMLTIHGRTRKELSKVPAHWDEIGQARQLRDKLSPATLLVGNGDVMSHRQGRELAEKYRLDGIMIGRGIFEDPYVFAGDSPWHNMPARERISLYEKHVGLFAETWQAGERPIHTLNKFCKIYINNFPRAKELREQLMRAKSTDELLGSLASAGENLGRDLELERF